MRKFKNSLLFNFTERQTVKYEYKGLLQSVRMFLPLSLPFKDNLREKKRNMSPLTAKALNVFNLDLQLLVTSTAHRC